MALLDTLARQGPAFGCTLHAHGVDHGLRAEAGAELDLAASHSERCKVPFSRSLVSLGPASGNLQARARQARYQALREAAHRCDAQFIVTAHHQADRAETVLLRLVRGTTQRGLGVLPAKDGDRLRPFLRVPREAILSHLSRHNVAFASDPSNADPRFTRVRIRQELLPLLRGLNPRIEEALCALADEALGSENHIETSEIAHPTRYLLPSRTQAALAALSLSRQPQGQVLLPRGLVALARPEAQPQVGLVRSRRPRKASDAPGDKG
jgi:tRNA(Ile)-lysidine synthase